MSLDWVGVGRSSGLVWLLRWVLATWARTARAVALVVMVFLLLTLAIWLLGIYGVGELWLAWENGRRGR